MTPDDQISELEEQAEAARKQEQRKQAAFLFEQARRLAIDQGQMARAFSLGVRTALCWEFAGDDLRALTVRLELLHDIPNTADPWEVYLVRRLQFDYLLESKAIPDLDELKRYAQELESLCVSIGRSDAQDIPFRKAELLEAQGKWAEALTNYEIASSRYVDVGGYDRPEAPYRAALAALRIGERRDAQRWLTQIRSDYWPDHAQILAGHIHLLLALYDNNRVEARTALLRADDVLQSTELPSASAMYTPPAVAALLLDERFGDPALPSHPVQRRLAEFPNSQLKFPQDAFIWHSATIIRQIAALRYSAGIEPVDDIYYRKPHKLRRRSAARLPADLGSRVAAARQACDNAMPNATLLDDSFKCSYRKHEIATMRRRIDEIATIHDL